MRFEYDPSKVNYSDLVVRGVLAALPGGPPCALLRMPRHGTDALVAQEYFYCIHDPTTPNRQGNDVGTQYRSSIFYHDDEQKRVAEVCQAPMQGERLCALWRGAVVSGSLCVTRGVRQEVTAKLQKERFGGKKIATEIIPEQKWWDAEDYHQECAPTLPWQLDTTLSLCYLAVH